MQRRWRMLWLAMGTLLAFSLVVLAWVTRAQTVDVLTLPPDQRPALVEGPADYGMSYEDVMVTTEDGLKLHGWYMPGQNGATVIVLHGSPGGRQDGLYEAAFLNHHGYNVLMGSFRAHDESDGDLISFGYYEVADAAAWHQYLLERPDVNPERIGIFGESMGGGTGILYTARHQDIRALVTASAFALTRETIETFIKYELDPPGWITSVLARFMVFWAERVGHFEIAALDTEAVIGGISPRPVLIIQGGQDDKISPDNGQRLADAAGEPKEFWFVPEAGHVNFEEFRPDEYAGRVLDFFDRYLLGE